MLRRGRIDFYCGPTNEKDIHPRRRVNGLKMNDGATDDDEKLINLDADPVNRNWIRIVARMKRGQMTCPACQSHDVIPVVYGFPSAKISEDERAGKIHLGGCVVDNLKWYCKKCGQKFGEPLEAAGTCEN